MPTRKQVKEFADVLHNGSDIEYLFSKLESVDWIPPLIEEGFFKNPYAPEDRGDRIVTPFWPQSRFLARLAKTKSGRANQQLILQGALAIPQTENIGVNIDLADIALALDPDFSEKLLPPLLSFVEASSTLGTALKLGNLISRLANGGRTKSAMSLASAVLHLSSRDQFASDQAPFRNMREPGARIGLWEYEQILTNNFPALISKAGIRAWTLLCDLLDQAIVFVAGTEEDRRPDDDSHNWRPAVEEHEQNWNRGLRQVLLSAVRDGALQIANRDPKNIDILVKPLLERAIRWNVFRRLALYLLAEAPNPGPTLVVEELLNRQTFDSTTFRHEYFLLSKKCFPVLNDAERGVIFGWIEEGLPESTRERIWENYHQWMGRPLTEEQKVGTIRQWKRERLAPIEEFVPKPWKDSHPDLFGEVNRPEHPDFTTFFESKVGPSSPVDAENLNRLSVRELVEFLNNWAPAGGSFFEHAPEGMGREITNLVSEKPDFYAAEAREFKKLTEPTYVRAVIQGFAFAQNQARSFQWPQLVELCSWASSQSGEIPGRNASGFDADPNWSWTGTAVVRLLSASFGSQSSPLPASLRDEAWRAIEPVTNAPDPLSEREQEFMESLNLGTGPESEKTRSFDAFTTAMNSARGAALEAVIQYALWLRRGSQESQKLNSLAEMPEVREVLDRHLDVAREPSLIIRAIYGQRFPWLDFIDHEWALTNSSSIFPENDLERWHVAWDSYITYTGPFDNVLTILSPQYELAIRRIGSHNHAQSSQSPDISLAQHLVTFYWRGKVGLDSVLIKSFYEKADGQLVRHVLSHVGRFLREIAEPLQPEVESRLKALWQSRLQAASLHPDVGAIELGAFGWWFISRKIDDEWLVHQLLNALHVTSSVDPDFMVIEELVQIAQSKPLECVKALEMMIKGEARGWAHQGWGENPIEIIRKAMNSGNPEARKRATALINYLGSLGRFEYGKLLE